MVGSLPIPVYLSLMRSANHSSGELSLGWSIALLVLALIVTIIVLIIAIYFFSMASGSCLLTGIGIIIILLLVATIGLIIVEIHNQKIEAELKEYASEYLKQNLNYRDVSGKHWIECSRTEAFQCYYNNNGERKVINRLFIGVLTNQDKIDGFNEIGKKLWFKKFNGIIIVSEIEK